MNVVGFNVKHIRFISQILISIEFIIFSISLVTTFLIHELFRNVCLQVSDSLWPNELQHIRLPCLNIRVLHIFWSSICWLTFNLGLLYIYKMYFYDSLFLIISLYSHSFLLKFFYKLSAQGSHITKLFLLFWWCLSSYLLLPSQI